MSTLVARKTAELEAKRTSLVDEVAFWTALAEKGQPLEKHNSQMERLGAVFESALAMLTTPADVIETWKETTDQLLGLHHVWDFFRSKLALRLVDRFRPPLIAADELAWACTRPFYRAAEESGTIEASAVRQPSLVYFDAGGSPFAVARQHTYRSLLPARQLDGPSVELLKRLPVPVIGIPWHQQAHLPETAIVAHEAAHIVDDDLGLVASLLPEVEKSVATPSEAQAWSRWTPEILADVMGTLQLGHAYGSALADVLATSDDGHDAATSASDAYPPPRIRLTLVAVTLEIMKHDVLAEELRERSSTTGLGVIHESEQATVEAVVDAITATKLPVLGERSLDSIDWFTPDRQDRANKDSDRLKALRTEPQSTDVRVLVAALVRSFAERPEDFTERNAPRRVLDRIEKVRVAGTREGRGPVGDAEMGAVTARDAETAKQLLSAL